MDIGFTNRKPAYFNRDRYPFVRLISARPGLVAPLAGDLLTQVIQAERTQAQPAAPRAAPRETPQAANPDAGEFRELDGLRAYARRRVADQLRAGLRDHQRASESEVDWLAVCVAPRAGVTPAVIESWLRAARPDHDPAYAARTVNRAAKARRQFDRNRLADPENVAAPRQTGSLESMHTRNAPVL